MIIKGQILISEDIISVFQTTANGNMKETISKHVNHKTRYCRFAVQRNCEFVLMIADKEAKYKGICMNFLGLLLVWCSCVQNIIKYAYLEYIYVCSSVHFCRLLKACIVLGESDNGCNQ
jgi:hypothetical protein